MIPQRRIHPPEEFERDPVRERELADEYADDLDLEVYAMEADSGEV